MLSLFKSSSVSKRLGVYSLVMITIGSVDSIRNLPTTALFGASLIFFFFLGALCFLLPGALVSAELSSCSLDDGGVYAWVKQAFGVQSGFLAVWFQWIENVIWYPTILSFVAGTIGYLISPSLAHNHWFLIAVILCAFWLATIINILGIQSSARFSALCSMSGLLLPMSIIILLGVAWVLEGEPLQIHFTAASMLPSFSDSHLWVALTGIILSFCGIEIATVHAGDVDDPQSAYPRAMWLSTVIILVTLVLGSLAIAIVIPQAKISLVAGLMQAYDAFFGAYHMRWILPLIAVMLILGGMGSVSNWIIAPIRGLLIASRDDNLPKICSMENKHRAPIFLLILQAVIVSIIALAFLLMPSINGSYWLLTALAAQLYMFMYIIMFCAGIKLRYKKIRCANGYRIPGGNKMMWFVAGVGILACLLTIALGFIPPENIAVGGVWHYETLLIIGLLVMSVPPFILYRVCRKKQAR